MWSAVKAWPACIEPALRCGAQQTVLAFITLLFAAYRHGPMPVAIQSTRLEGLELTGWRTIKRCRR